MLSCFLGSSGLLLGILTLSPQYAAAAQARTGTWGGTYTCTGTLAAPGTLAGSYADVVVNGACVVNAGSVDIHGNLIIAPGASLAAIFGQNDQTKTGNSDITVHGNIVVQQGASLMLGCYSLVVSLWGATQLLDLPDFPCVDDPNQNAPTLNTHDVVDGNVIAHDPLGVILHNSLVRGNVVERGGGAGLGCVPTGIFNQYFGLPEYSDYASNKIGGKLVVSGLNTCWFGVFRESVRGNMAVSNNVAGPDATEIATNTVHGNLSCRDNSPAVELGDSDGQPNKVGGDATGECGFNVTLLNPPPSAGVTGVTPTPQPASVPLHHHH